MVRSMCGKLTGRMSRACKNGGLLRRAGITTWRGVREMGIRAMKLLLFTSEQWKPSIRILQSAIMKLKLQLVLVRQDRGRIVVNDNHGSNRARFEATPHST